MRTHPVDYGFHVLSDKHVYDLNKKNYLQIRPEEIDVSRLNLPEKYVCIAATATERVKELLPECINEISDYVISKGYTPVYMGKTLSDTGVNNMHIKANVIAIDFTKGINLLDKTNMLESAKVMSGSAAVVGCDGGMIHLAAFTDCNIIASYTFVSPEHLAPIRKGSQSYKFNSIVPPESLGCRGCQTNLNFLYSHDFRNCIYDDYKCVELITSDMFIEHLEKIL